METEVQTGSALVQPSILAGVSATQIGKAAILRKICDWAYDATGDRRYFILKEKCDAINHACDFPGRRFRRTPHEPELFNIYHQRYDTHDGRVDANQMWLGTIPGSRPNVHAHPLYYEWDNFVTIQYYDVERDLRNYLRDRNPPGTYDFRQDLLETLNGDPRLTRDTEDDRIQAQITALENRATNAENEKDTAKEAETRLQNEVNDLKAELERTQNLLKNAVRKRDKSKFYLSIMVGADEAQRLDEGAYPTRTDREKMLAAADNIRAGLLDTKVKDVKLEISSLLEEAKRLEDLTADPNELVERVRHLHNERKRVREAEADIRKAEAGIDPKYARHMAELYKSLADQAEGVASFEASAGTETLTLQPAEIDPSMSDADIRKQIQANIEESYNNYLARRVGAAGGSGAAGGYGGGDRAGGYEGGDRRGGGGGGDETEMRRRALALYIRERDRGDRAASGYGGGAAGESGAAGGYGDGGGAAGGYGDGGGAADDYGGGAAGDGAH